MTATAFARALGAALIVTTVSTSPVSAQDEDALQNLQFFSPDIGRDSLIQVMRGFSFNVRSPRLPVPAAPP